MCIYFRLVVSRGLKMLEFFALAIDPCIRDKAKSVFLPADSIRDKAKSVFLPADSS